MRSGIGGRRAAPASREQRESLQIVDRQGIRRTSDHITRASERNRQARAAQDRCATIDCSHLSENARHSMTHRVRIWPSWSSPSSKPRSRRAGVERFHARQLYRWIYRRGVTDFDRMTDLSRTLRAQLADEFAVAHAADRRRRALDRRHPQVRARAGRRPADRVGLHPRHAGDDVLHLDAGRLRDGVRLLPDRQDGPGPQPDGRRDRRPGPRARRGHRPARPPLQHRADGNGRAAAQLRQHDEGAAHAPLRARPRRLAAARHAVDGRHRPRPRAAGAASR